MANVLITNISLIKDLKKLSSIQYVEDGKPRTDENLFPAVLTNESILNFFAKKNIAFSKIIALTSKEVDEAPINSEQYNNTYAYFEDLDVLKNCQNSIVHISFNATTKNYINDIVANVCRNIKCEEDNVYVDISGGDRTINYIVQSVIRLLIYKGVKYKGGYYANIQNKEGFIVNTNESDDIAKLADALNEFMTTGKADQLNECFNGKRDESCVDELLNKMTDFSDNIRLGNIDGLDDIIDNLKQYTDLCQKIPSNNIQTVILQQFIPVIKTKLLSDNNEGIDYSKIVYWCLENGLIQQAITIFVEKIPKYIFDKDILRLKGGRERETVRVEYLKNRKKTDPAEWEPYALYTELLNPLEKHSQIVELQKKIKDPKYLSSDGTVNRIYKDICNYDWKKRNCKNEKLRILRYAMGDKTYESQVKFFKSIEGKTFYLAYLLGITTRKFVGGDETMNNKFDAVCYIEKNPTSPYFKYDFVAKKLVDILYGYIYIKALRNQINHASSDENLTKDQKEVLESHGFNMDDIKIQTITENMRKILDLINE